MGDVPAGGVPWEVFNAPQRERIEYWANKYGIPVQMVMNQLWRESGFGNIAQGTGYIHPNAPTHGAGVSGPAGLNRNTYPGLGVTDPLNFDQAVMGLTRAIRVYGTGGTIQDTWANTREGRLPFDPVRGAVFYNGGPGVGMPWEARGRDYTRLNSETRGYLDAAFRGVTGYNPSQPLPSFADAPERANEWRINDASLGLLGPLAQVQAQQGRPIGGSGVWDMPANWGANPTMDFWRLQEGPRAILGQAEPWKIPGLIAPEYGHYLQTLGLMPANLVVSGGTDFTNTTWNAPAGSQPGWWGPWGAPAVHNWAQEGVSHGYGDPIMSLLGNLNYQLTGPTAGMNEGGGPTPNIATAGIDLAHWIAQTLTGQAATSPPSTGLRPDMDIWDAAPGTTTGAPIYVPGGGEMQGPIWQPAGGTWGTPGVVSPRIGWLEQQAGGGQGMIFNPATMNWGTFAGSVGNQVEDYNRWYERVIGGLTPTPEGFNPVGPTEPSWGEDLATMYGNQPGRPGFGAALNPVFAGMYYSQIPTQVDIIHQQQMAALDYAMRHPTIGGWTQTNTGNYVPDPTYIPPPPGPTPGAINIYGQINPLGIPGQGGFNMLAQPGSSATGSMGGSHDQPGPDTPRGDAMPPPASIGPAQGTVGGLDPETWLRMYRGGPGGPMPGGPPPGPPGPPPPGISPGSDTPPPGIPQAGPPPPGIGPAQGTVGGLDPSTWLQMYRGGAAQPAPMPWQIGSTFAPQNMMF